MEAKIMNKAIVASDQLADIGADLMAGAVQIKERVVDTFEESVDAAKTATRRALRRSQNAAEELLDNTACQVKRHPFQSVGITLGVGLTFGLAIGWLVARKR